LHFGVESARDKFVAHLDLDEVANIPKMDWAYKSALYYFNKIMNEYQGKEIYAGIPTDLESYYRLHLTEARAAYKTEA
jgi:hypothetical protein